jgi:thiamine biosynthesis lipoprotein
VQGAFDVFKIVEATCSRFDPCSDLTRINATPARWHRAPPLLFEALREAHSAHVATGGLFDPRVHDALVRLGYDRSFSLGTRPADNGCDTGEELPGEWRPSFIAPVRLVRVGERRVDLGGIGKGLAIRWAAARIRSATANFLIDAGGDCYAGGVPATGESWRIGVESPEGAAGPVAVLEVEDRAVATSSIRVRSWRKSGHLVHHLVDPRTGASGGVGLSAVTVVDPDPARAEVLSKAAFLRGAIGIGEFAAHERIPALWLDASGAVRSSPTMDRYIAWLRS